MMGEVVYLSDEGGGGVPQYLSDGGGGVPQ